MFYSELPTCEEAPVSIHIEDVHQNEENVEVEADEEDDDNDDGMQEVIDSSDVVLQVLDARDPNGTRCMQVENYLQKEKPHKHLIFVLNKADLVPNWAVKKWVAVLSAIRPTLAFRASITNCFGKGDLISLLRQFGKLHQDKKQISVGLIGYPNVGKSSIINALKSKKVCNVAPIPGETKVWQYVTLMNNLFLIDCPGVVYPYGATPTDMVLKGVVRVEKVKQPEDYVHAVLERVKEEYLQKTYGVTKWDNPEDFLEQVARKSGRLLKGGEADISTVAKNVLNDYQRGKIPYFVRPPESEVEEEAEQGFQLAGEENTGAVKEGPVTERTEEVESSSMKIAEAGEMEYEKQDIHRDNNGDLNDESIDQGNEILEIDQAEQERTKREPPGQQEKILRSKGKKKEKKPNKKKVTVVHPFLERAGRKLGDIKKKMSLLKQNLKNIQARRAQRQADTDENDSLTMPSTEGDSESNISPSVKCKKCTSLKRLPSFIKVDNDDIDDTRGPFKRGKRYMDAQKSTPDQLVSSDLTIYKRKQSASEASGLFHDSRESSHHQEPKAKKNCRSAISTISTSSGTMVVSYKDEATPGNAKSEQTRQTVTPTGSGKKVLSKVSSSQRRKKQRGDDEDDAGGTPKVKGLEMAFNFLLSVMVQSQNTNDEGTPGDKFDDNVDESDKELDQDVIEKSDECNGGAVAHLVGYQVRGLKFESPSGPSQYFIAPLCAPSTKWVARSLKARRK
ncbi:nucleolar GTP-binding protein 2 [Plakobranchus ocellatus]|uniref:Nucleolar GTP-binding protein 2 n=1 Tax=Plakobranchus ocellatus TaxID=259542 RepID=A0AAV4BKS2_9GAST|nr:nucleolar GTP-binding protein 2 [Plakobranchus ocellatus]